MPKFVFNTNVSKSDIPNDFMTDLSKIVAESLGKPEMYVTVHVNPDQMMIFEGNNQPCATASLCSIGKLGVEENKAISAKVFDFVNSKLKIDTKRMYIIFNDLQRADVGWNGSTFAK